MNMLATARLRLRAQVERLGSSLWFLPTVTTVLAAIAAEVLGDVGTSQDAATTVFFNGGPDAARTILATITGSMITVTGLIFSLTVVALQVASGQFTPRLLRTFLADRGNQIVLSAFIATFAYSILLLRQVRDATETTPANVPGPGVSVGIAATGVCVGLLVYFIHHLTDQLRVETVMRRVLATTLKTIDDTHRRDAEPTGGGFPTPPDDALRLNATSSGYLQSLDADQLFRLAGDAGVNVRLRPWLGDYVVAGTTLAWAWPADGGVDVGPDELDVDDLAQGIHDAVQLGEDRTSAGDVAFGIRQMVDIAVRALSPGVNDPTTAVQTVHLLTDVLVSLGTRPLHDLVRNDERVVVGVPRPAFAEHLDLAHRQIRRYGAGEPAVVRALARQLRDLAETVDVVRLEHVVTQLVALEAAAAAAAPLDSDAELVADAVAGVERVLQGRADHPDAIAD